MDSRIERNWNNYQKTFIIAKRNEENSMVRHKLHWKYKDQIDMSWGKENYENRIRYFNSGVDSLQESCLKIGMNRKIERQKLNMNLSNMNDIITYFYTDSLSDFISGIEPKWVRGVFNKSIKFIRPSDMGSSLEKYPENERIPRYGYKLPHNNPYCQAQKYWAKNNILLLVDLLLLMGFGPVNNPDRDIRRKDFYIKFGIILNNIVMFAGLRCLSLNWDSIRNIINERFRMPNYIIENYNPKALPMERGRQVIGHSACLKKMDGTKMETEYYISIYNSINGYRDEELQIFIISECSQNKSSEIEVEKESWFREFYKGTILSDSEIILSDEVEAAEKKAHDEAIMEAQAARAKAVIQADKERFISTLDIDSENKGYVKGIIDNWERLDPKTITSGKFKKRITKAIKNNKLKDIWKFLNPRHNFLSSTKGGSKNMFEKIINPITKKKINVNSKVGYQILLNYIKQLSSINNKH